MRVGIDENNLNEIEKVIKEWLESEEKELTLFKNPSVLEINVNDSVAAETGLV